MNTNLQGNIGETIALKHFIKEGYEVYLPFGTATSCDMIVLKDGLSQRVSVKSASTKQASGNWRVRVKQGKLNKTEPFDPDGSDLLFVYIVPEDRYVILKSKDIGRKFEITLKTVLV